MKENFLKSLALILKYEGGFSSHPFDPGGATNQGITLRTLQKFNEQYDYGDFDHNGDIDVDDIHLLDTPEKVAPIYKKYFWDMMKLDDFPNQIDFILFDFGVNSGPKNAFEILQRALNKMGQSVGTIDGVVGRKTKKALEKADKELLIRYLLNERDIFYRKIVAANPSQEIFLKGWLNRIASLAVDVRSFS